MKSKPTIDERGIITWRLPNGNFHREDGPAIEHNSGYKGWWINGKMYSEQEYKNKMRLIKLKHIL